MPNQTKAKESRINNLNNKHRLNTLGDFTVLIQNNLTNNTTNIDENNNLENSITTLNENEIL